MKHKLDRSAHSVYSKQIIWIMGVVLECLYYGFSCNRDYNASRNIPIAGMEQPAAPMESKPLYHISMRHVLAMK